MDVKRNDTRDKPLGGQMPRRLYLIQFSDCPKLTFKHRRHLGDRLLEGNVIRMFLMIPHSCISYSCSGFLPLFSRRMFT